MRNPCQFGFSSQILDIVWVLDVFVGKLEQTEFEIVSRGKFYMTSFAGICFVAGRKARFCQKCLSMASAGPKHHLDSFWVNLSPVNSCAIFLLQLAKTVSCGRKIIHELKIVEIEGLSDNSTVGRRPVRNVCRAHNVGFDFSRDTNDANFGPIFRSLLVFGQKLLDRCLETFNLLGWDEGQWFDFCRWACFQIKFAKS